MSSSNINVACHFVEAIGEKHALTCSFPIVERSINLAYSAVETFPDKNVHITNELIHNPMVNERLHTKNVNFIKKDADNSKDFSQIKEGDVVMLPAFGATLDEMK